MKRIITVAIVAGLALTTLAAQTKQTTEIKGSIAKMETAVVKVPTIVCNSCVSTITKALKKVDGVKTTKIDLEKKIATVTYVSTKTTLSKIEKAIAKAGYDANDLKRDPAAYEKLDACCKADAKE
jgi:periplasmic mercuric ion binding protein